MGSCFSSTRRAAIAPTGWGPLPSWEALFLPPFPSSPLHHRSLSRVRVPCGAPVVNWGGLQEQLQQQLLG
ncbi:hypothetical protein cyc_04515 [Cyclospora cayetanensis]|uniref:Uncharacterized protein n=1 Tax=Cyclospora cayetanensis TaxID=88456 RepID=A0A1D3D8Q4_9EIME|nr:hypothetical protein cyc_04515 [Cyclospora cayetanensis]